MSANRYAIKDRWKFHPLAIVSRSDFTLGNPQPIELRDIAEDPTYSLYCLDFETRTAVWTRTPEDIDISKGSFIYASQFEHTTEVAITSINELAEIVERVDLSSSKLTMVQSVGRCGSTLVNRVFASQPQIFSLSEPDTFTQICEALGAQRINDTEAIELLQLCFKAALRPLPHSTRRENVAFKFRSQCITLAPAINAAAPHAKSIYLTREPKAWLRSAYRAFVTPDVVEDMEFKLLVENLFAAFIPIVAHERNTNAPMSLAKVWMLNWIHNTLSYRDSLAKGIRFLTLDYADIRRDPHASVKAIFDFAAVENIDWTAIEATLARDSQADSTIARETVKDNDIPDHYFEEATSVLYRYLPEYAAQH